MKLTNFSLNNQVVHYYPFESEISYIFDSCTLAKTCYFNQRSGHLVHDWTEYRKYRKKTCSYNFLFSSVAPMTTTSSQSLYFLIVVSHIYSHSWRNYTTQIPAVLPVCDEKQTRNRKSTQRNAVFACYVVIFDVPKCVFRMYWRFAEGRQNR